MDSRFKACDKDLGGMWVPLGKGRVYIPLRCNVTVIVRGQLEIHNGACAYTDPLSGNLVVPVHREVLRVDERGCVVPTN